MVVLLLVLLLLLSLPISTYASAYAAGSHQGAVKQRLLLGIFLIKGADYQHLTTFKKSKFEKIKAGIQINLNKTLTQICFIYLRPVDFWPFHLQSMAILKLHSVQCLHL